MSKPARPGPFSLGDALVEAFATNDRITCFLIENLDDKAWSAEAPLGEGRTIRAIVSHLNNNRVTWLKMTQRPRRLPPYLDYKKATRAQALRALPQSRDAILKVLREALATTGRVRGFTPDALAFFTYQVAHDAHHRGQIMMRLRQMGYRLPVNVRYGIWHWSKRWREAIAG